MALCQARLASVRRLGDSSVLIRQCQSTAVPPKMQYYGPLAGQMKPRRHSNILNVKKIGLEKAKLANGKSHLAEDWRDVWPVARQYDHNVVHLPIRMGHPVVRSDPVPDSISNQELLKIPNFLHLTPKHIDQHIEALKPLCTKWPTDISEMSLPVRVRHTNYLRPGSSTLHPKSHILEMSVHIDSVPLFKKKIKKLKAIAGDRYSEKTGILSLKSESLPTRKLNKDHLTYQLMALYFELKKEEDWEKPIHNAVHNL